MTLGETDALSASNLLKPRTCLPWKTEKRQFAYRVRPYFIDNRIIREHRNRVLAEEGKARTVLRDSIDGELAALSAAERRFWMSEFRFVETTLTLNQLAIYAPAFVRLSQIMPRKMVFCRRMVVRKYLDGYSFPKSPFFSTLARHFVRSSVLFFPSERLTDAADRFIVLATRSADQSRAANRQRVALHIRSIHLMSDAEICELYEDEDEYLEELALLADLARHYGVGVDEVFRISAAEIGRFWSPDR